jgi:hypothetical protein
MELAWKRASRQMVPACEGERIQSSGCLQAYRAQQEVWLPRAEQGRPGSLRSTGVLDAGRQRDDGQRENYYWCRS